MLTVTLFALIGAPSLFQCPHPLLERDGSAKILRGSEQEVLDVFRAGGRLRVGWYRARPGHPPGVVHWVEAGFLTERAGHVYAQFGAIHTQRPTTEAVAIKLPAKRGTWYGLVGSDGFLQGRRDDDVVVTRPASMIWCESPESFRDRCANDWRPVYRHDTRGRRLSGAKSDLVAAVHSGRPLRMGWGGKKANHRWAHNAAPVFVTVIDGSEVVANLPEHLAQQSYHDAKQARFIDQSWLWRGLLSTDGSFDAVWIERGTGKQMLRVPQRAAVTWWAFTAPSGCKASDPELSIAGGVIRDPKHSVIDNRPRPQKR